MVKEFKKIDKIIFLVDNISYFGGAERVVINLSNEFVKDYQVNIVSMYNYNEENPKYSFNPNIKFINIITKNKIRFKRKLLQIKAIRKEVLDEDAIIIGIGAWNSIMLPFFRNKNNILIASEHLAYDKIPIRTKVLRKILYRYIDGITCLTQNEIKKYMEINKNVFCIPNFIEKRQDAYSSLKNKRVIAIGRLDYQKGFDNLLKIWKYIENHDKDWELVIFGDGPLKEELIALKDSLELTKIYFKGTTNEIEKELINSSIFVLTSRYEGFPLVLLEALSHGVPCISFDCPSGPNEIIINDVNGYIVENQNNEVFSKLLLELINNTKKLDNLASNTKKSVEKFNKVTVIESWRKMFNELESKKKYVK